MEASCVRKAGRARMRRGRRTAGPDAAMRATGGPRRTQHDTSARAGGQPTNPHMQISRDAVRKRLARCAAAQRASHRGSGR
ncbi:hypothetical protein WJ86_16355 [Burkholderia multivorans]|nr:hypothetical protein WM33_03790 [Burkholderia multivorans]KVP23396.1 hypothetical protein WJ86_16355 [Burkholderia multivorans]KVZ82836.1 hypothetical protein WL23_09095 [Burkholderia multivorans]